MVPERNARPSGSVSDMNEGLSVTPERGGKSWALHSIKHHGLSLITGIARFGGWRMEAMLGWPGRRQGERRPFGSPPKALLASCWRGLRPLAVAS